MTRKYLVATATAAILTIAAGAANAGLPAALQSRNGGDGIFIDASQVDNFRKPGRLVIIDIRVPERYAKGHIPGAISIPREEIETPEVNGVMVETKSYYELQPVFAKAGLTYDDTIIVYGERDGWRGPKAGLHAGKIYVSLNQAGFDKVHVLDGGIEGWKGELSKTPTVLPPTDFKLTKTKPTIVDKEYVRARLGREKEGIFVLDFGIEERYARSHIKGAHDVGMGLFTDTNKLRDSLDGFQARLTEIGVKKDSEIIASCGWGWAAADGLALLKDLGYTNIKLYDGSWTEWAQDPTTPKAGSLYDKP